MNKLHSVRTFLAGVPAALHRPFKITLPAFILALLLTAGLTAGASAAANRKQIVAYENYAIAIKLDGEVQTPTDANGKRVYPISYQGTTYLPIRAVGKMLDIGVDWDQATKTVLLGDPAEGVDLIDAYKAYYINEFQQVQTTDKQKPIDISGKTYSHWIGLTGAPREKIGTISFNIEGKYDTVTFKYYASTDITLQVVGDNDYVLAEIPVKGGQVAQSITVDLLGTSQLTFKTVEDLDTHQCVYIVNALLK